LNPAEDYIVRQEEPYRSILLQLQAIVKALVPQAELLYKWRIPFYYFNGIPLCFFNQSKDYVDFAFWHHDKMDKFSDHFIDTNRKLVRSLRYSSVDDIDEKVIVYVIQKQLEINSNPFKLIRKN